jgi:histidyl-tRNA synthetase
MIETIETAIEQWKDIPGWEGVYQISSFGRLKSFKEAKTGRILSNINSNGDYLSVILISQGRKQATKIHRLVAELFIPNPESKPEVNHKDTNKQNNRVDNLEWATKSENMIHAVGMNPEMVKGMNYYNQYVRPKSIIQLSLTGEIIAEYPNGREASEATGVCHRNIIQVASGTEYKPGKVRKQAGGFAWRFK